VRKFLLIVISAVLLLPALSYALDVPALKGRVNDYADMISPEAESLLDERLKAFEASDSTQVVILTVNSLEGDALEDYTIRVAEQWKIGQAKKDNGVILFASKNDRRMRIEVGRGLEGVLTDLLSGRILDNVIRPKFRSGDFDGGFLDGTGAIIDASRGEFKNDAPPESSSHSDSSGNLPIIFFILLYIVVTAVSKFSKLLSGGIGAVSLPAVIHFGLFPIGLAGIAISAITGFILALIIPYMPIGGGFSSSGSGRSSSFGGGGFSGGGGSFGGGGSSGGW
jgi:uncharacterized protein